MAAQLVRSTPGSKTRESSQARVNRRSAGIASNPQKTVLFQANQKVGYTAVANPSVGKAPVRPERFRLACPVRSREIDFDQGG
jgi:hypothetical protein